MRGHDGEGAKDYGLGRPARAAGASQAARYNSEPNAAYITLKAVATAIDSMRRTPA
jgi:hypothetical protein